jgi:hypothetical protein
MLPAVTIQISQEKSFISAVTAVAGGAVVTGIKENDVLAVRKDS